MRNYRHQWGWLSYWPFRCLGAVWRPSLDALQYYARIPPPARNSGTLHSSTSSSCRYLQNQIKIFEIDPAEFLYDNITSMQDKQIKKRTIRGPNWSKLNVYSLGLDWIHWGLDGNINLRICGNAPMSCCVHSGWSVHPNQSDRLDSPHQCFSAIIRTIHRELKTQFQVPPFFFLF